MNNDNAHIEAVFKTVKYCPAYPYGGFGGLKEAREWIYSFVEGYNHFHRHSAIKYVTPDEKHAGLDIAILANRRRLYEQARKANPERWIRGVTRDWEPVSTTTMNKGRTGKRKVA